ncbi:glycosyltransferase family 8 protein [Metabacillus elymi]|uniref:Glycosyltransferase family 8 protein n=1 Tax=Metabacillus elymi TaxID=2745198 RepID=A0ABX6RYI4_9BACI|nr:glycosyltransferase family 8 protein [Metabacillus sp. KUDC1714]QNF26192.1 glycosyltransferase family 8 protein [Metabacillus sp. KUDC1714]
MDLSVVYSSDNNYAQHVGVSMLSLFENNTKFNSITVYLIENNVSQDNKNKLKLICENYRRSIVFIGFKEISNKLQLNIENTISMSAYARLFLPSVIDEKIEKILYLDCDSVINSSLEDLWNTNICNYYVAGVKDTVSDETKQKVYMEINKPYINSGMLLINLKKWREDHIEKRFIEFINSYNGQVFHHDQGTINGVLHEKFLLLHPKYNAMTTFFTMTRDEIMQYYRLKDYYSEADINEAIINPIYIHYTPAFVNRPWIKGCKHPLVSLYKKYLDMTPWKGSSLFEDKRRNVEKMVAFLYNNFPFKLANSICNIIFK